ncbi:Methylenetetrahydrofolate reductase 1 [Hondaea fermentalgiana]|uniref:Methylenetetrahydrofolate reductase 1 n=1 Tax=Hondaea fermentalgiana TaxID=2315210 RepID=A0A2R5G8R5_9STRA|nr:Methylenetetrahydrofolate reductase 1 [Hondaea fermentalgiana]|eukprot:GBG26935.1 Methylenetetrahydrofolate reductase 1 [Hondaea fermentalgiana]
MAPAPLISDLVADKGDEPWIAFEYYPPKTEKGVATLYKRLESMKELGPLYADFTWGAGGSTSDLTLELAVTAQDRFGLVSNMHLTCTNMPREKIDIALEESEKAGIRNILALRGDPPAGQEDFKAVDTGFSCALDLVRYIREKTGDLFSISVAGYPEGHPTRIKKVIAGQSLSPSEQARSVRMDDGSVHVCSDVDFHEEMLYLKQKVDAGAQMIVTQMFYDVQVFLDFVEACKRYEINVPVIPGIMCITSYGGYKRMCAFCKTRVTPQMYEELEAIKDDEAAVSRFAVKFGVETCQKLLDSGVKGLHFYTLNLDKVVTAVLEGLGMLKSEEGEKIAATA